MEVARCCASQFRPYCFSTRESKIARAARKNHVSIFQPILFQSLRLFCHVEGTICPISFVKETLVRIDLLLSEHIPSFAFLRRKVPHEELSISPSSHNNSSPTPSPPSPPSSPRNGTPITSPLTATLSPPSTAPRPPPSKPTSATSPPATSKPPTTRTCKATCGKTGTPAARTPLISSRMWCLA